MVKPNPEPTTCRDRMEKDARMCDYAKEGEDPHEDKGVISPWFDTDEECMVKANRRGLPL